MAEKKSGNAYKPLKNKLRQPKQKMTFNKRMMSKMNKRLKTNPYQKKG